jgi:protease I
MQKRAVITIAQGVEDAEFIYPFYRLQEAGFVVDVATKGKINIVAKHGLPINASVDADVISADDYDLLVVPGGYESPDRVRQIPNVLRVVKEFNNSGKVITSICHGPWVLISAGIVKGRKMTCYVGCKDDLVNAGADYSNEPVVIDNNIITSPHFRDNAVWMRETITQFEKLNNQ